jgi:hypothetical protein
MSAPAWKTLSIVLAVLLVSFAAITLWREAARQSLGIDPLEQTRQPL